MIRTYDKYVRTFQYSKLERYSFIRQTRQLISVIIYDYLKKIINSIIKQ